MEHLMTSEEVAEYLHVDPVTIRRLVSKGDLAAYRIGADYRFAPSDIEDYLQRQRVGGRKGSSISPSTESISGEQIMVKNEPFDQFTQPARRALNLAQEEAQGFQHHFIDTEHLLLGLLREGIAAQVLSNLGIDLHKARSTVEPLMECSDRVVSGEIGFSPRAKKVIELAVDEAHRRNQRSIGTAHLLLAIVREGEGGAASVLERLGIQPEKVRTETIRMLQQYQGDDSAAFPSVPPEAASLLAIGESALTCRRCAAHCPVYFRYCFNCGQQLDSG